MGLMGITLNMHSHSGGRIAREREREMPRDAEDGINRESDPVNHLALPPSTTIAPLSSPLSSSSSLSLFLLTLPVIIISHPSYTAPVISSLIIRAGTPLPTVYSHSPRVSFARSLPSSPPPLPYCRLQRGLLPPPVHHIGTLIREAAAHKGRQSIE